MAGTTSLSVSIIASRASRAAVGDVSTAVFLCRTSYDRVYGSEPLTDYAEKEGVSRLATYSKLHIACGGAITSLGLAKHWFIETREAGHTIFNSL